MHLTYSFIFIYIMLIHFLGDFALQTNEQATKKSSDNIQLIYHVSIYSAIWFIASLPIIGAWAILFAFITYFTHFITDYCSSRIGKSFWDKQDMHNGFVIVGFDQIIHFITLWYTLQIFL